MFFSRGLSCVCVLFLTGVFIASIFNPAFSLTATGLLLAIFVLAFSTAIVIYPRSKELLLITIIGSIILFAGIFLEENAEAKAAPKCNPNNSRPCDIHYFNDKEVLIKGVVATKPQKDLEGLKLTIRAKRLKWGEDWLPVKGRVLVHKNIPFSRYEYKDIVKVEGNLKTPQKYDNFNYRKYLQKERIYSVIYSPSIKVLEKSSTKGTHSILISVKKELEKVAQKLPFPEAGILSAVTLGDKNLLSQEFKEKISSAGISHITAISGMHIMIIFGVLLLCLIKLGLWRWQATLLSIIIISFYIILIGAPASAVRAGIMGTLLISSQALGRLNQSSRSILIAATAMVAINPLILTRDVGFQLSFLAALGIIYLFPIFKKVLRAENSSLKQLIALTLSAQLFCFPIIIYHFGSISILSPVTNLLVLPLLPFILGIGTLYLVLGALFPILILPLSFLILIPLSWITLIANTSSQLAFSQLTLQISPLFILCFYILIIGLIYYCYQKYQHSLDFSLMN